MAIKRLKKQPRTNKPIVKKEGYKFTALQQKCSEALILFKSEKLDKAEAALRDIIKSPRSTSLSSLVDHMLVSADFHVSTYREGIDPGLISVSASYDNFKVDGKYRLPWTLKTGERPVMYYKHKQTWVAVAVCFLTICLRTDKPLWLKELEPTSPPLRRNLTRIKKVATRN